MTEPRRLKDVAGIEATLLRSADQDAIPDSSRRALAVAIGLAPVPVPVPAPPAAAGPAATVATKATAGLVVKALVAIGVATGIGVGVSTVVGRPSTARMAAIASPAEPVAARPLPPTPIDPAPAIVAAPAPIDPAPVPVPALAPIDPARALVPAPAPIDPAPAIVAVGRLAVNAHATAPPADPPATPTEAPQAAPDPVPQAPADPVSPPPRTTLTDEVTLIDGALAAIRRHEPARALALLDDYDHRFPTGTMGPEAVLARIDAMLAAGEVAGARALGSQFLAAHPTSPLAQRVRDLMSRGP